jgi:hypothetical protein
VVLDEAGAEGHPGSQRGARLVLDKAEMLAACALEEDVDHGDHAEAAEVR